MATSLFHSIISEVGHDESSGLVQLAKGTGIGNWIIEKKLGEGGFGAVYLCTHTKKGHKCAMKVESSEIVFQVLRIEVLILGAMDKRKSRHFCKLMDRGCCQRFNFLVMSLVGKCLYDLSRNSNIGHLSLPCALSVGIQAVEALEDLHSAGFVHRDIKPMNFTIGRPEVNELRRLYLLDFGLARRFLDDKGKIRPARRSMPFRGSERYASIPCHREQEIGRKDDIESWIYMMVELICGRVPWKELGEGKAICEAKVRARAANDLFQPPCPKEFQSILQYCDGLGYADAVKYDFIIKTLRTMMTGQQEFPYDWEGTGPSAHLLK